MARPNKIWWWKAHNQYAATINGKRHRLGKNLNEAKRRFGELLAKDGRDEPVLHVAVVLDHFLEWSQLNRPDSYRWYRDYCQSFLDANKKLRVDELKPHHVETWSNHGKGKRGKITAIKRAFNWAAEQGIIDSSPIAHMKRPTSGRRDEIITEDQLDELLSHVPDQPFRDLLTVSWECGCRPQETRTVESRFVELDKHRWLFPRELSKTKRRPRLVYMTGVAEAIVRRRVDQYPVGPIFRNTRNDPWTSSAVKCRFSRLEAKIGRRLCQYNFRHSWITRMIASGVDSHVVAVLAGHSNTSMIDVVYSHVEHQHDFLLSCVRGDLGDSCPSGKRV